MVDSDLFSTSVVVVDNDAEGSARGEVDAGAGRGVLDVEYVLVPQANIAMARNAAVAASRGDYISFIDDDELPGPEWLCRHLEAIRNTGATASLGPVIPYFSETPPAWYLIGGFGCRERFPTGTELSWRQTRTGNVLLDRARVVEHDRPFDPSFGIGGEDIMFFRQLAGKGGRFVWCDEAPVYELVPPERCKTSYMFRRAFLQGSISSTYSRDSFRPADRVMIGLKAVTALGLYSLLLPVYALRGRAAALDLLIRQTHHLSRLLTVLGIYRVQKRIIN